MANAPTLYQFDIALNHTDRNISETLSVRTARHPSETMSRVWLRMLAFAWHWQERIAFGPGLSDPDTPDLLAEDLAGNTVLWIRVGKAADPAKIQRAVDQHPHARVAVFFESPERMATFVADAAKLTRLASVELVAADPALVEALSKNEERRIKGSITIAGDHFYIERGAENFDGPAARGSL